MKKPWYKKWWIWLIAVVVIFIGLSSLGSSSSGSTNSKSNNTSSKSSSKKVEKNTAVAKNLNAGTFKVGADINPGRYMVKATSGSGNFTNRSGSINVILGTSVDNSLGQVDSYTVTLVKGEQIKLEGIESASFTPTPSKYSYKTELSAGSWTVGKDIKPGRYDITATQGSGNIDTNDGDVNEILGTSKDSETGQVTKVTATLHKGQVLNTSLEGIKLTAK